MNPTSPLKLRRIVRPGAAAIGLAAALVLALLGATAQADMYRPGTNAPGGVPAQATITSQTTQGTNTTLCWYGMQGWYSVERQTNGSPWTSVGRVAASDHAWSLTVDNGGSPSAFFRLNQNNAYAGSGGCAGCHGDKFDQWGGTAHATALDSLAKIGMDKNPDCIVCHTVGFGQPSGYTDSTKTPYLSNVGCENCHGPAAWHKYSDHELIRPAVSIDPAICGGCHQDSHHPTYEEYETTLHAEVNDDVKYGFSGGTYYTNMIVMAGTNVVAPGTIGSSNVYGFYVTTNPNLTLKTNQTTGIIHSGNGPGSGYVYDPGQDRAVGCGICHSAATRLAQLNDYEARLQGYTNALVFPAAKDSAAWSAACATCHDPHEDKNPFQLRNPTRSTNYYTMPTTADKRTVVSTNSSGTITTNVVFMSAAFANMYDPNIQVCAQCHNSRGARWDGRSYGYITNGASVTWGLQTNISLSRPPHHSPQYNLLVGILQPDYFNTNSSGVATNWIQRHGAGVSSSSGNYNTNQCATCHVPSYSVDANTKVTGHTFELDTKNCTLSGCHGSVPLYEETQLATTNSITRVVSLLNQWALAKGTNTFGAGNATKYKGNGWDYTTTGALAPTPNTANAGPSSSDQNKIPDAIKQARFNIYMVLHDGSLGVHNPRYASALTAAAETNVLNQFTMANFKAYTTVGFAPLSVGFTNLGTGVTGYNWSFGDGNTSTAATPTNAYASRGLYSVTLAATGASGSETVTRTNYITVATKPVVSFTASPTTGKAPLTVSFTNTSTSTIDVTAWRWTINGVNISTNNPVYTFTNTTPASYNISLRASTPAGNITTTSNAFITVTQ